MEVFEDYSIDFKSAYYQILLNGKTDLRISEGGISDNYSDPGREYRKNSHGYRSEEFSANADILIGGCSHTYGLGLEENLRWGDVLAKKLGLVPQTISESGKSISWIVEKIMSHISIFGRPRMIICLFPDFFRVSTVVDSKVLYTDNISFNPYTGYEKLKTSHRGVTTVYAGHEEGINKNIKYIKKPFDPTTVMSRDAALHQSIRSIRMLEKYCNDLKIPFVWGTWDHNSSQIANAISTTDYKFDNFIDITIRSCSTYRKNLKNPKDVIFESTNEDLAKCQSNHKDIECDCYLKCHEDYQELVGSDQFNMASDTLQGADYAHYGAHMHIHFAEAFLKEINHIE